MPNPSRAGQNRVLSVGDASWRPAKPAAVDAARDADGILWLASSRRRIHEELAFDESAQAGRFKRFIRPLLNPPRPKVLPQLTRLSVNDTLRVSRGAEVVPIGESNEFCNVRVRPGNGQAILVATKSSDGLLN